MTLDRPSRLIHPALTLILALALVMVASVASAQERERKDALLTDEEIDLIKVYEVKLDTDPPPRIVIPRNELRNFLKDYQEDDRIPRGKRNQDSWLRTDGHEQLALLFQLKAREYYKHVRIRSQIESLRTWSNIHRRYIFGYFQPLFGSGEVPGLSLIPRGRESGRIEMTNFYILTQTVIDGKPLIDRNVPDESLLVQWGLPRESAKFPAPEIKGWQARFRGPDDERFIELVKWIESLVAVNQGSNYDVSYKVPSPEESDN